MDARQEKTEVNKKWRAENPDKVLASNKRKYNTPDKRQKANAANRKWKDANKVKDKALTEAWNKNNTPKLAEYSRTNRKKWKVKDPSRYWFNKIKQRALKRGLAFNLTPKFLDKLFEAKHCAVTGIAFNYTPIGKTAPWAPSIDQIIAGKGYTKKNVQIVCWAYNVAKHDWSAEIVETIAKAITKGRVYEAETSAARGD